MLVHKKENSQPRRKINTRHAMMKSMTSLKSNSFRNSQTLAEISENPTNLIIQYNSAQTKPKPDKKSKYHPSMSVSLMPKQQTDFYRRCNTSSKVNIQQQLP